LFKINFSQAYVLISAIRRTQKSWFRQLHGGEIKVETKEGEGAEFIVKLPEEKS